MDERVEAGDPRYDGFRIEEIWGVVAVDKKDDQEGFVVGFDPLSNMLTPLVASDEARLKDLLILAQAAANKYGTTFEVVKFTTREHVKNIEPEK